MQLLKVVVDKALEALMHLRSPLIFLKIFLVTFGGGSTRRSSNRGNDLRYDITISLEEAYKGLEKMLNTRHIKNVHLVQVVAQQKDLSRLNVIIVLEEVK